VSVDYKNGFCDYCKINTKFCNVKANHVLHLLLAIVTFGLWLWDSYKLHARCFHLKRKPAPHRFFKCYLMIVGNVKEYVRV
jgi:hypothetical protein